MKRETMKHPPNAIHSSEPTFDLRELASRYEAAGIRFVVVGEDQILVDPRDTGLAKVVFTAFFFGTT